MKRLILLLMLVALAALAGPQSLGVGTWVWGYTPSSTAAVWTYTDMGVPYFTNTATTTALHLITDLNYTSSTWADSRGTGVTVRTNGAGVYAPTSTSSYKVSPTGTLRTRWKEPSTLTWAGTTTARGYVDFSGDWTACEVVSQVSRPGSAGDYSLRTSCQDPSTTGWNTALEETGSSACPTNGSFQVSGVAGNKFVCTSNTIPVPFDDTMHVICYGRNTGATTMVIMLDNGPLNSSAAGAASGFSATSTCYIGAWNFSYTNVAVAPTGTSVYEYISFATTTPTAASLSALETSVASIVWPNVLDPQRGCLTATVVLGSSSTEQIVFGANSGSTTKILSFAAATTTPSMTDGNGHTVTARLGLVKGAAISLRAEWSNILGTMVLWNLTTVTSTSVAGFTSLSSVTNATSTPGSPFFQLDWVTSMKLGSTERACD